MFLLLLTSSLTVAQKTTNPLKVQFVTADITNFWTAFDSLEKAPRGNPFDQLYIKKGSPGLIDFIPARIKGADSLLSMVLRNKSKYLEQKENSLNYINYQKQCQATFLALKYLYPEAVFPPVYFVIGRFNSGGHSAKSGLIIGAEMNRADRVPYLVAHELIHFQQDSITAIQNNLLAGCINEGTAEFLCELISGGGLNKKTHEYGNAHEEKLWKEFQQIMYDKEDNHDWMYNYQPKNGYPPDLGYWIGYKIVGAFYNKSADKQKAIKEILHIQDYRKFLKDSGYAPGN